MHHQWDKVSLPVTDDNDNQAYLLTVYAEELSRGHQARKAEAVLDLLQGWERTFVKVEPANLQMDQTVSTE